VGQINREIPKESGMMNTNEIVLDIADQRRKLEMLAVAGTGAGKLFFMDYLQWIVPFLAVSIIGWTMYIYRRWKAAPNITDYWGYRRDNLRKVFVKLMPFGFLAIFAFFGIGYWQGTINITWHIIPILLLYPIWGLIQQFLVMSLFAGNLKDSSSYNYSDKVIILLTAILFAIVHYPYNWLIAGTFILALVYGYIFLRERNLYALGLFHGWLGGVFYYTVMTRDPWLAMMGSVGF